MKHKQLKLCFLLFLVGLTEVKAQESVVSTGANISGSGGTVSYSVGQIVYNKNSDTNFTEAQGVQQPYEISVTTNINQFMGINLFAYPNPTSDFLILEVTDNKLSNLNFQLIDISGKLLNSGKITDIQTNINMITFTPATYFLKVIQVDNEIRTFKIIKK